MIWRNGMTDSHCRIPVYGCLIWGMWMRKDRALISSARGPPLLSSWWNWSSRGYVFIRSGIRLL